MGNTLSYRLNVMEINSIDTFLNIRGGCRGGVRDVYFVRALGESPGLGTELTAIDRKMEGEMAKGRAVYLRWRELPRLSREEDISFYRQVYQSWSRGETAALRTPVSNPMLRETLDQAVRRAADRYRAAHPGATDTMTRNFAIKLWYWADSLPEGLFSGWNEHLCVKVLADNVGKEQEYLFYYMLTQLGADVLLLNSRGDTEAGEELMGLSHAFRLGEFGRTVLPQYVRETVPAGGRTGDPPPSARTESRRPPVPSGPGRGAGAAEPVRAAPQIQSARLPVRGSGGTAASAAPRQSAPAASAAPQQSAPAASAAPRQNAPVAHLPSRERGKPAPARSEKSFEELAALASSIVMIAVLDGQGRPVATGSGIMIGRGGFILTNHHVIREGRAYAVRIEEDEEVYTTDEVIKYNSQLDMAVIRIRRELKPLPICGSREKLVRGQRVVAIGSPMGLFNSVSDGIISGFRNINGVDMIQFTAPISHGSSGGAVLNLYGEVIGISTAGIDSGQNLNLAVNCEDIRWFARGFYG